MIRLTIARYYTPSGRCIQKPFTAGDTKDYESDIVTRYEHGEFFSQDSIKHQVRLITPASVARCTAVAASRPTSSCPRTRSA